MMSYNRHGGGCSCGQTRYQLIGPALIVHACHCRICQKLTGSTNAVNILIEAEKAVLQQGETIDVWAETPSGHGQAITRCKYCYSAIWSDYKRFSKQHGVSVLFVRAGTLDAPEGFPPDVHIYTESMQPHFCFRDGIPVFDAFYDLQKVWPVRSLARLKAAATQTSHTLGTARTTRSQSAA